MRAPGPRLAEGIVTHAVPRPVDVALAVRQHEAYVAALRVGRLAGAGRRARRRPAGRRLRRGRAGRLRRRGRRRPLGAHPRRRGELPGAERAARELGLRIERIKEPGTLDGGDVLQVGDTVYVGRSARTNEEGICQLAHLLGGRRVVPVDIRDCLHLKSAMTALPDGVLIGDPEKVDTSVLPCLRVPPEPSGAHVVVLGPDHVLMAASAPRTAAVLAADGLRVTSVDISEFEALDGCVTCLSVLVR